MGQSCQGMPITQAMGANITPKICSRLWGNQESEMASQLCIPPRMPLIERNQREKRNQHGGNVERKMQAVGGPSRHRAQQIFFLLGFLLVVTHDTRPAVFGCSVSGTSILAISSVPGAVMMTALSRCFGLDSKSYVSRHDSAGDVRHAAGHDGHQFRAGQVGQKGTDGQRRFGLSHENAGRDVQRFGAARAHDARHYLGNCRMMICMTPK